MTRLTSYSISVVVYSSRLVSCVNKGLKGGTLCEEDWTLQDTVILHNLLNKRYITIPFLYRKEITGTI